MQNNNINNNPNKAEFIRDTSKNILNVEIGEPAIILKYIGNEGKMKIRKFNILEEDENKLLLRQKNIIECC